MEQWALQFRILLSFSAILAFLATRDTLIMPRGDYSGSRIMLVLILFSFLAKIHLNLTVDQKQFARLLSLVEENKLSYKGTQRVYELLIQYLNSSDIYSEL